MWRAHAWQNSFLAVVLLSGCETVPDEWPAGMASNHVGVWLPWKMIALSTLPLILLTALIVYWVMRGRNWIARAITTIVLGVLTYGGMSIAQRMASDFEKTADGFKFRGEFTSEVGSFDFFTLIVVVTGLGGLIYLGRGALQTATDGVHEYVIDGTSPAPLRVFEYFATRICPSWFHRSDVVRMLKQPGTGQHANFGYQGWRWWFGSKESVEKQLENYEVAAYARIRSLKVSHPRAATLVVLDLAHQLDPPDDEYKNNVADLINASIRERPSH